MLVLTRKSGERIHIGDSIVVTVLAIQSGRVRIGIEAPSDVPIARHELLAGARAGQEERAPADQAVYH
jgi:carbon storage regulator